jgi:hypothetical protein
MGIDKGVDNIEEYFKFSYAAYSSYILSEGTTKSRDTFLGYDNGQCIFAKKYIYHIKILDPNTTNAPPPFDVFYMLKTYLDFAQQYVSRLYAY